MYSCMFGKHRIVVYTSDLMLWTGKSRRACQQLMARIRREFGKQSHQPVTIREYCRYAGIDPAELPLAG